MRAYFKILQSPKVGNLKEIDEFQGAYIVYQSQEVVNTLNGSITTNKTEEVTKSQWPE